MQITSVVIYNNPGSCKRMKIWLKMFKLLEKTRWWICTKRVQRLSSNQNEIMFCQQKFGEIIDKARSQWIVFVCHKPRSDCRFCYCVWKVDKRSRSCTIKINLTHLQWFVGLTLPNTLCPVFNIWRFRNQIVLIFEDIWLYYGQQKHVLNWATCMLVEIPSVLPWSWSQDCEWDIWGFVCCHNWVPIVNA